MKKLMILGTTSSAGKSIMTAGILRALVRRGLRVTPFKAQNMSRFSVRVGDCEISSAQAFQAQAAKQTPSVLMNPILLKPNTDNGSEVLLMGKKIGSMDAQTYFKKKETLMPMVKQAFESLSDIADYAVIEGAGSPAEINLRSVDLVNLGLAEALDAEALLVGDVDRGGVFAAIYGTYFILPEQDRRRIRGFIINKFRGDVSLLLPGVEKIEELTGLRSYGVMPYLKNLLIDDEDSASDRKGGEKTLSDYPERDRESLREAEFERLADEVERHLDVEAILQLMER